MLPNNKRSRYKSLLLGLAILLVILLSACGGNKDAGKNNDKAEEKIIVTYEGGAVTESEFNGYLGARKLLDQNYMYLEMMPDFQTMVLNQYIAERVLSKDVSKEAKKQSKEQATAATKNMKKSIEENAEQKTQVDAFMKENGIDFDDLENYVYTQYNLQAVLSAKFTDAEIRQQYEDNLKANQNAYTKATVRHVLVAFKDQEGKELRTKEEALVRANEAYEKLKSTGDWDKLALEYSDDGNKDKGGIYEDVDVSQWVENFKNAALNQPLNEIGKPIETEYGYHVVVVEARNSGDFEAVKNSVKIEMINEFFMDYIEKEVPKLIIGEVNLPKTEVPETPEGTGDGAETEKTK
ncbi:MAG: peptidylprolyl isomerase [Paenibacillaceae bacterium]